MTPTVAMTATPMPTTRTDSHGLHARAPRRGPRTPEPVDEDQGLEPNDDGERHADRPPSEDGGRADTHDRHRRATIAPKRYRPSPDQRRREPVSPRPTEPTVSGSPVTEARRYGGPQASRGGIGPRNRRPAEAAHRRRPRRRRVRSARPIRRVRPSPTRSGRRCDARQPRSNGTRSSPNCPPPSAWVAATAGSATKANGPARRSPRASGRPSPGSNAPTPHSAPTSSRRCRPAPGAGTRPPNPPGGSRRSLTSCRPGSLPVQPGRRFDARPNRPPLGANACVASCPDRRCGIERSRQVTLVRMERPAPVASAWIIHHVRRSQHTRGAGRAQSRSP